MGKNNNPDMPSEVVLEIVQLLNQNGIDLIIDGGWAVDALLGKQTRPHDDLDLAVFHNDVTLICSLFDKRGYKEVPRDDSWECNFVYGNDLGHLVDIHSCTFDEDGKHIYGVEYPWQSLQGSGEINGVKVRCIPPDWLVDFHSGYPSTRMIFMMSSCYVTSLIWSSQKILHHSSRMKNNLRAPHNITVKNSLENRL